MRASEGWRNDLSADDEANILCRAIARITVRIRHVTDAREVENQKHMFADLAQINWFGDVSSDGGIELIWAFQRLCPIYLDALERSIWRAFSVVIDGQDCGRDRTHLERTLGNRAIARSDRNIDRANFSRTRHDEIDLPR